jgi:uncharacterized membrane protein YeaQ/YmgE (transglycosylase-associated protein family)
MAFLLLVPCAFASAQTLTPGTRVRVKSSQVVVPVIGNFQGMRRDTVVVIEEGAGAQAWTFRSSEVDRIEVSAGMKGGNAGPTTRWALIGAGVGVVTGVLASAILEASTNSKYDNLLSGVVGAGIGGAIGAAYGFRKPQEHWTRVAIPRRVGILPTRDGVRVGFSSAF